MCLNFRHSHPSVETFTCSPTGLSSLSLPIFGFQLAYTFVSTSQRAQMKKLLLVSLLLASTAAMAQKKTVEVTVDIGACMTKEFISSGDQSGDEWELELVVVENNKEIKSSIISNQVDCDIQSFISGRNEYVYNGPEIKSLIELGPNQSVRVRVRELDTGVYWLFGGSAEYNLGTFHSKQLAPKVPKIMGVSPHLQKNCLKLEKF
jgi:hypothetical protein